MNADSIGKGGKPATARQWIRTALAGGGSGSASSGPNASSSSTAYHAQSEGVNNILSPHGLEPSEQDSSPYGNVYPSATGNNGVGNEPY